MLRSRVFIRLIRSGALLAAAWLTTLILLEVVGYDIRRPAFESAGIAFGTLLICYALSHLSGARGPEAQDQTPLPITPRLLAIPASIAVVSFAWAVWLGPLADDYVLHDWAWRGRLVPDWGYLRPLPLGIWWLVLHLGAGWLVLHALNIVCHATTAVLLSVLAIRVFNSRGIGIMAGLFFVLFPASLEAVGWTAGVFDAVMTTCIVAAAVVFLLVPSRWSTTAVICGLALVGLLTKETSVALPLLLAALVPLGARLKNTSMKWLVITVIATGLIASAYVLARSSVVNNALAENLPQTRWQVKNLVVRPFAALVLPFDDTTPLAISAAAALGVIALFTLAVIPRRQPGKNLTNAFLAIGAGFVWVLACALPLLREFYVAGDLQGSRYVYLPLVGFSLALAGALQAASAQGFRWLGSIASALICGAWLVVWPAHVDNWRQAAATRDAFLMDVQRFVNEQRCGGLEIRDAPDNVRGAYVLRQGLPQVLQQLQYVPGGRPCQAAWRDGRVTSPK